MHAGNVAIMAKETKGEASLPIIHQAARYASYQQYIFTVSGWIPGMGHICLPKCVEAKIKSHFPSDGVFVGYKARIGNTNNDMIMVHR